MKIFHAATISPYECDKETKLLVALGSGDVTGLALLAILFQPQRLESMVCLVCHVQYYYLFITFSIYSLSTFYTFVTILC